MFIEGMVMNASKEERDLTSKDGSKRHSVIFHVLLTLGEVGKDFEVCNVRAYDADWPLPEIGKKWKTPRVRRYENFDGNVADVSV
ncbi:MAG: hypothetical protein IJ829_08995 [Kiritimatiellae bacterium]|nr:hypothetical protein [Kiritimatiellia bacterium]